MKSSLKFLFCVLLFCLLLGSNNMLLSQLQAPVLISPENNSEIEYSNISFTWEPVYGATSYQILINNSNSLIIIDTTIVETTFSYSFEIDVPWGYHDRIDEYYSWKVKALNENDSSQWSENWNFNRYEPAYLPSDNSAGIVIPGTENIMIGNRPFQIGDAIGVLSN